MPTDKLQPGTEIDSPEVIFTKDIKVQYPDHYANLLGVWQRLAKRIYPKDGLRHIPDNRFINARDFGLDCEDINSRHGVDFLNDIIPSVIERVKKEGTKRKVRILDLGCGLAFAADQIRTKFGDDIKVFGTSLVKGPVVANRKRRMVDELRFHNKLENIQLRGFMLGGIDVASSIRDQILASIGRDLQPQENERKMIHSYDAKWRSILELSDYPEFDLIIDTFGELHYANDVSYAADEFLHNFNKVFRAAIKKLSKNGRLYIADLTGRQYEFIETEKQKLEQQYGVTMAWKETHIEEDVTLQGLEVTKN